MTELTLARQQIILEAASEVFERLGNMEPLERYEMALTEALRMRGIGVREGKNTQILFGGASVGVYLADIIIDGEILIELKCVDRLGEQEKESFGTFVRDFGYERGYLVNVGGEELEIETFPSSDN
jgi:GxxExxY protein